MGKEVDNKSSVGLSKSTKTLLIVVVAIMLIVVIFLVVKGLSNPNNNTNKNETALNSFSADLQISQVEIANNTDLSVKVDKGAVEGELKAVNFIFYDENGKEIKRSQMSISNLENNDYLISFKLTNTSKVESISITPIFINKSGGSVIGKVEDEYTMTGEENTNNNNGDEDNTSNEDNTSSEIPPECILDSDCNDNNSCTTNTCSDGNCSYTLVEECVHCTSSSQCEDSNSCTTNICSDGKCSYPAIPGCTPCGTSLNCEDNNSCTNNLCMQGRCFYTPMENCQSCTLDSECEDNNACTSNTCYNGACTFPSISNCKVCTLTTQCEDNDSSTIDSCSGNKCVYTKITSCISNDKYCPSGCTAANDNDCSYICGNGIREGNEKCDGVNLGGATCSGVLGSGYGGTLKCYSGLCTFDTSLCVAPCTCSSDGNLCTTDQCVSGVCQHTAISGCCTSNSQCTGGKVCTGNVCVTSSTPPPSNPICGDGACNGTETCSSCSSDCGACVSYSRIFYVNATTGSDSNTGTSPSSPWKTISKVNSQASNFKAGDAILFRRGDTWHESLTVSASGSSSAPITYGAYGSGEKPIMNGFTTVTGWTSEGNGIYSKIISTQSMLNIVSVDGNNTPIGRWPDTGWLFIDSHDGTNSITDNSLSSSPNWNGGEVVIRKHWWITDRNKITSHSGNTIYYTSASEYEGLNGNGYFIQNHKDTLNKIGDWAYDGSKLYIYFGNNDNPNNHVVRIPTLDKFVYLDSRSYISFDNLHITGYNTMAVTIFASKHITITNCLFDLIGDTAVDSPWWTSSDYPVVENNVFDNINNDAIHFRGDSPYASIQYNTIQNIGIINGLSGSADGSGIGIQATGANSVIRYNTVKNIGYNGITFGGVNTLVSNNFVDTFCMNKDDGAGIYIYADENTGTRIINNIVINGIGDEEGTYLPDEFRAHGVYIDGGSDNVQIYGNSLANNHGSGIFINPESLNLNIQNNTAYNNAEYGIQMISNLGSGGSIRNINIQKNIFFAREANQVVLHFVTGLGDEDVKQIGTVDNNYYTRPINEAEVFRTQINAWDGPTTLRTLAGWQSYSKLDANSKKAPKTITSVNDLRFEYNPTSASKSVSLASNYIDVKGNTYSGTLTLSPYSSVVLIKN